VTHNAVVSPHRLSAEAGRRVLESGGNAVDSAIAVVAAQGVVAPETCGLGGDLFALVHHRDWDRPRALNSSGRAGANADGSGLSGDRIPEDHPLVVTVPGCVDGLVALSNQLGRLPLGDALQPAIELARKGFPASREQAQAFRAKAAVYRHNPAVASFYPGGEPVRVGDHVTRPELASTLEALATTGDRDTFYLGLPGEDIITAVGGLITKEDLGVNQAEWVEPVGCGVFGATAWTMPPNSQGYLGPATLAVFEMLDPPDDPSDPRWWHLMIEAYRSLAWERDDLATDPATTPMTPADLVDPARLEKLAGTVGDRAGRWPPSAHRASGTAYMCVADSEGIGVSIIQSNYYGTGSPFGAARSGFLLHDRGRGFNAVPGHSNEVGPGKRPMHTLSPTLWTRGGDPRWLIGTRGGDIQPQLIAQLAARIVGAGVEPIDAQAMPRWSMVEFGPGSESSLYVEPDTPGAVVTDLRRRGHQVTVVDGPQPGWGPMSVIGLDGAERTAAADPRVDTTAALVF
jgi:gamma-glutamyltranspeptidase / glutathione hydrolase